MPGKKIYSEEEVREQADPSPTTVSMKEQLRETLTEVNKLKREVGDDQALFEHVKDAIKELKPYERVKPQMPRDSKASELQAVLIVADAHSEESVRSIEMEGSAHYDWDVFKQRMTTTADKAIEITNVMRQSYVIKEANVFYLGDWFLGQIHSVEHGYGTTQTLPRALPGASRECADQTLRIAANFDKVNVCGMCGNHGRDSQKPVTKMTADRNWDMALYLIAQEYARAEKRISWTIPQSMMTVANVMGWKCLLTHGDCVKRSHAEPLFAIGRMVDGQHRQRRKSCDDFDYAFVGHWHDESMLHGECTLCPPLIGPSQLGRYKLHQSTPAGALLYFFSEKHGRTCLWRLNL